MVVAIVERKRGTLDGGWRKGGGSKGGLHMFPESRGRSVNKSHARASNCASGFREICRIRRYQPTAGHRAVEQNAQRPIGNALTTLCPLLRATDFQYTCMVSTAIDLVWGQERISPLGRSKEVPNKLVSAPMRSLEPMAPRLRECGTLEVRAATTPRTNAQEKQGVCAEASKYLLNKRPKGRSKRATR